MRIYIAGPMTGMPELNHPEFFRVEEVLKENGHIPINPARNPHGLEQHHYMDICMALLRSSEAILLLKGWGNSKGAMAEYHYAEAIGLYVMDYLI